MSGNRANAAARNRRAGELAGPPPGRGMPPRPMMQPQQMRPQMQQQQPHNPSFAAQAAQGLGAPKQMTIQDAVALMTIRLSRVETFVQKFESETPGDENSRIVDDGVFNSIVSRLDALERGHKLLTANTTNQVLSKEPNDAVKEELEKVKADLGEVKYLLLKLQAFTMETNQKLLDVVMRDDEEEEERVIFVGSDQQDYMGQDLTGALNVNLKDLIQQELAKTEEVEAEVVAEDQ